MSPTKTTKVNLDSTVNLMGHPHGNQLPGGNHWGGFTCLETVFLGMFLSILLPSAFALGLGTSSTPLTHPAPFPTVLKDVIPRCQDEKVHPHPSSLRILNYFFTNLNRGFHATAIYNPKGSCTGESKSWILAFHLLVETQIWELGEHEHLWYN